MMFMKKYSKKGAGMKKTLLIVLSLFFLSPSGCAKKELTQEEQTAATVQEYKSDTEKKATPRRDRRKAERKRQRMQGLFYNR